MQLDTGLTSSPDRILKRRVRERVIIRERRYRGACGLRHSGAWQRGRASGTSIDAIVEQKASGSRLAKFRRTEFGEHSF
jgi:hypothetical protein